jgi:hypothetical protein
VNRVRPQVIFLIVVIVFVVVVNVVGLHNYFTEPYPSLADFMYSWEGTRSFFVDGLNLYGDETSLNIQTRIYGGPAPENDLGPGFFAYPFYMTFPVLPLVFMDYAWASAIWLVLLEACLIGSLVLLLSLFRWRPAPLLWGLLMIWALVDYFASRGLILGQPALLVYFLEVFAIWALFKGNQTTTVIDVLSGAGLAVSTIKPQMGFLIVPLLLLWGLRARRWTFVVSFVVSMGVLLLLSFVLQPTWLGDWLQQVRNYSTETALGAPVWIVMEYYLHLGAVGEWAVNLPLYGLMLWAWYTVLVQNKQERFLWTIVLTLIVTNLVAPRTATPHYVIFTIPLVFYFRVLAQRDRRRGSLWVMLILLAMTILTWVHAMTTVVEKFEHPTVYLPLPISMLAFLLLTRQWWWDFVSPPTKLQERAAYQVVNNG